ncbi:MAG: conserved hypothetical signal peptide protein [Caulobacter sp.]|nr:conserved hypothetical signal peptide protein [Caulobacter sp.]
MPRVSFAFFIAAVVYGAVGMVMGMVMGASNDHTLMPVHAHVNLLGWASLAIMGGFYGVAGARAPIKLAWVNFVVSNLGILIVTPLLAVLLKTGNLAVVPAMAIGEILLILGMVLFGAAVVITARRPASTGFAVA